MKERKSPQYALKCMWSADSAKIKQGTCEHSLLQQCCPEAPTADGWAFTQRVIRSVLHGPAFNNCSYCLLQYTKVISGPCAPYIFSKTPLHKAPPPQAANACRAHWAPSCWVSACQSARSWWRHGCSWQCGPADWVWGRDDASHPCQCGHWRRTGCPVACYSVWTPTSQHWALCN